MNLSIKRTYGKALAIVLAVSMLLTGPVGVLEAYAEDGTPSAVESVDSETQDGGVSSSTLEDSHSSGSATPSDVSLGTSSVQDSGAPIQQRSTGGPTQLAASVTATVTATVGYNTVSVNLTGSESFADASVVEVADNTTWLIEDSNLEEVEIISISRQSDKNVRLTLLNLLQPGTYTLFANAAVFNPVAGGTQEFNVTVHTPVPAVGTATATAGGKTIAVNLTQGGFANSSDKGNWTLGGTSASGNPIAAVSYQNGSNVTITLTNPIGASDNYTLQAEPGAFANIMTMPFAAPLNVTISGGATAPAFAEGYPKAGSMQMAGSRQVSVAINAQVAAYYDFVLLPDGADAPSAAQVRDGKAANGQPALKAYSGKNKLTADTGLSTGSFTPDHNTDYDLYVILRDDEGNLSTPVRVDVKSPPAADFLSATYPKVGDTQPNGSKQVQIQVQVQGTGQEGKVYWVLLPDGEDAPTVDEVGAGTANGGGAPVSSGSPEFAKDTLSTFLVTGAQDATAYDLYLVVGDSENFNPLAECTDVVKLDVTTPAAGANAFQVVGGAQHATLSGALGEVGNNGTIKLLRTVNTTEQIVLLNKTITLDLNGFDLNISSPANEGIKVTESTLAVIGSGKLCAAGKFYGVWANKGTVTVDDAASSNDGIGVFAMGGANITVRGNAIGQSNGVYADNIYTKVTVKGNVTSTTGQIQGAVYALGQAEVIVEGNVSADSGYGVHTSNSGVITVEGNVTASRGGAYTEGTGGSITIKGDLSSYNHCAIITSGSSGNIMVEGEIKPLGSANYVLVNNVPILKAAGIPDPGKSGYLKYSGSGATGVVWVKQPAANVCEIAGGPQYTSLTDALGDVTNGQTIKLLQNITHTASVEVNGMGIIFDLNGFDLTIDTSAENGSTALLVKGGGVVNYTGAGKFSAIGNSTAVHADGAGSELTVDYAETTRGSAYTVQATAGGDAAVNGNVLAKEAGTSALWATGGGKITVEGNVTCAGYNSTGVASTGTGSTVHVTGDITATAIGTGSTGVNLKGDGEVTINGNIAASQIGITTSGLGNAGTVTVTGNVSITGTATGSGVVDREGIGAGGNGTVLVTGNVSAAGENCTGVYANGSTVTVTGNVTSENTGVVSTGNASLPGSVTIDGKLTASTTYIKVGTTPKTAAEDTKPSDQAGYLKYTDGIHSVYVKDASGIILVSNATELEAALGSVKNGGTIRLTANINYSKGIVVDAKTITLDVGSFTLNVSYSTGSASGVGLNVINSGHLNLAGSGAFNVTHTSSTGSSVGVYADTNCSLTVTNVKSVSGTGIGAYASGNGSVIRVLGNVEATGNQAYGAATHGTGKITIDGIMTATYYTKIYTTALPKSEGVVVGGYLKYALALPQPEQAQGIVLVKIAPAVCEIIGGAQYDNLPEALAAATSGKTIKLLDDIIYEKAVNGDGAIKIGGKTLTFDLNGNNLTIRNPEGAGLQLNSKANVTVTGTGTLNILSQFAALNLDDSVFQSGENANVVLQSALNLGIQASYQSTVNIPKGSVTGVAGGIYTLGSNNSVTFGGPVTVNGKPDWDAHGINLSGNYIGNIVQVSGDINIASGLGAGIHVENGGTVTVGNSETPASVTSTGGNGIWTRQGSTTSDITVYGNVTGKERAIHATGDADIKVFGDVKSTSGLASVYAVEGFANSGDVISVNINGNVEGPNGVKYHGNNGTISVTGNVTATSGASDTVGVYASYGSVSVTGNVASISGIGAEAGENGEITIDGVLTGNTYVKVYYVSKTAADKTLPTTKANYHTYKQNSAVVWVKDGAPATSYLLTVQNGTGGGSYLPGTPVSITANPPAPGKVFDKWTTSGGESFGNANSASTTFTMPANAVTVTATYKDAPTATYLLTVVSGTGGGTYAAGAQISITANPPAQGKVFDKWTTSGGGSFGNANSTGTTFTMPSGAVTVTATYKDAPVGTFTLTVSGSYAQSTGAGQYAPSAQVSIHAGSRSNYSFNGWTSSGGGNFANANSASTIFTMPSGNVTVTANWRYSGGGGGSSDNNGNPSITPPVASEWLERSGASAPIAEAKEKSHGYALTRANGQYGVRAAAWAAFSGLQYWHDTMDGNAVQVRVYVKNPTAITTDLLVSGYTKGPETETTKTLFEKYFNNKVRAIHLDQTGSWGQSVEIAAKVNLTGMDVTKLYLYSYDKATNTYRRIEKLSYWVDVNGYLHFVTPYAGDIVISEGPLTLKNGGAK